jgi:hypothetical protein
MKQSSAAMAAMNPTLQSVNPSFNKDSRPYDSMANIQQPQHASNDFAEPDQNQQPRIPTAVAADRKKSVKTHADGYEDEPEAPMPPPRRPSMETEVPSGNDDDEAT